MHTSAWFKKMKNLQPKLRCSAVLGETRDCLPCSVLFGKKKKKEGIARYLCTKEKKQRNKTKQSNPKHDVSGAL
jgi:hypothetical protein